MGISVQCRSRRSGKGREGVTWRSPMAAGFVPATSRYHGTWFRPSQDPGILIRNPGEALSSHQTRCRIARVTEGSNGTECALDRFEQIGRTADIGKFQIVHANAVNGDPSRSRAPCPTTPDEN